jgi:hypothetical protein
MTGRERRDLAGQGVTVAHHGRRYPGRNDNPVLGTGGYAQSWHIAWLFIASLIIAGGAR